MLKPILTLIFCFSLSFGAIKEEISSINKTEVQLNNTTKQLVPIKDKLDFLFTKTILPLVILFKYQDKSNQYIYKNNQFSSVNK